MATTFVDYTGDGNATKPFSFPSYKVEDIKVEVDEVIKTSGNHYNITSYTTTGGGNVVFTSGNEPSSPSRIRIFRDTDVDNPKATYEAGSSVKADDLNNNNKQLLYSAQEEQNQTIQTHKIKDSAVTSAKIQDGAIVNADVNTSAAIAGTKISPDFGSQNIATTGTVNGVTTTELAILDGATVTTAELNILDGVTATTSEVNILDGVTATTTEINKLDGVTADTAELNILDGVTATTSELNIMDGVTATTSEINTLDGITATTTELNLLDGVTATTTELNLVDGVTATTAELNFVDGVTSNVQTQLDAKQPLDSELTTLSGMQSGTASILADGTALTATTTELNQLDGITLETSLTGTSDQRIPTSKAVNDQILAVTNAIGGFVAIADETSFPTANPDPSNGAGTVVSISQVSSGSAVSINGSGVATIANGAGTGNTVTITGFPTTLRNTSLAASSGLQVQTTTTLHTYTFHKQLASAADISAISATVNSFSARYRVSSSAPTSSLDGGDLWYDTTNSKLMVYSSQNSAWEEATAIGNFFISTLSSSSSTGGGSATANGTAYRFTLSDAPTSAQQLLVSVDGVIQKPNSGSSQPSEGYVLVGNDIIFGSAPVNGASIFVTVIGSTVGIGTPSDNTVTSAILQNGSVIEAKLATGAVTEAKLGTDAVTQAKIADDAVGADQLASDSVVSASIVDGSIVNADINASAAIAGTKISPDFGSQNIVTTGHLNGKDITLSDGDPAVNFTDSDANPDFKVVANGGIFRVQDSTAGTNRVRVLADGTVDVNGNLDVGAGLDVTGNITVSGTVDGVDIAALNTTVGNNSTNKFSKAGGDTITGDFTIASGTTNKNINIDVSDKIRFDDNLKATFGSSDDLQIYHDGSSSKIQHTNTTSGNNLLIESDTKVILRKITGSEKLAQFNVDGAVELYHDNSKKFETTSSGATVTGTCTATAFAGDGSALTGITSFVSGMIIMYNSATAPSGWYLCDGNNGTPDLRDRFIVGAGNSYSQGATGGSNTATDNVSVSVSGSGTTGNQNWQSGSGQYRPTSGWSQSGHNHSFSFSGSGSDTVSIDTRSPYYALTFIMKA